MTRHFSPRELWDKSITEENILEAIKDFLELHKARVIRIVERIPPRKHKREKKSMAGIPDLMVIWPHRFIQRENGVWTQDLALITFIEVKKPGAHRRPAQIEWIRQAQEDGVIAFFAESIDDVIREFKNRSISL